MLSICFFQNLKASVSITFELIYSEQVILIYHRYPQFTRGIRTRVLFILKKIWKGGGCKFSSQKGEVIIKEQLISDAHLCVGKPRRFYNLRYIQEQQVSINALILRMDFN